MRQISSSQNGHAGVILGVCDSLWEFRIGVCSDRCRGLQRVRENVSMYDLRMVEPVFQIWESSPTGHARFGLPYVHFRIHFQIHLVLDFCNLLEFLDVR